MKKTVLLTSILLSFLFGKAQITNPSPYCDGSFDDNSGPPLPEWISKVTLGSLNNPTNQQAAPHYVYYNNLNAVVLTAGNSYTISFTFDAFSDGYGAWIDFNHDNVFDTATEKIAMNAPMSPIGPGSVSINTNFTVPLTAVGGITRMRVRQVNDQVYNLFNNYLILPCNACSSGTDVMNYGECEDYDVNIITTTNVLEANNAFPNISYAISSNTLSINKEVNETIHLNIFNAIGQLSASEILAGNRTDLDLSNYPHGIYFLQLITDKGATLTKKWVR
ncbi:MAG: GEVED domain-containing protein [Bacteroidota bacterium]